MITSFNTDVALANLFAYRKKANMCISYNELAKYIQFIQIGNPLFLSSNISQKEVSNCARRYRKLFKTVRAFNTNNLFIRNPSGYKPNLDYFMQDYCEDDRKYIERLTKLWIQERLS